MRTNDTDGAEPQWEVLIGDVAEADIENAFQFLAPQMGEERAFVWVRDLYAALYALKNFPGPFAYPLDEAATTRRGRPLRRLLYRGPKQKPITQTYRAFYFVVEPKTDNEIGLINVVRILHGAASWPHADEAEEQN